MRAGGHANCLDPARRRDLLSDRARFEEMHASGFIDDEGGESYLKAPPPSIRTDRGGLCNDAAAGVSGPVFHAKVRGGVEFVRGGAIASGRPRTNQPWSLEEPTRSCQHLPTMRRATVRSEARLPRCELRNASVDVARRFTALYKRARCRLRRRTTGPALG